MSLIVVLYAAILVAATLGLWAAYRVLGTPSRLAPIDYATVLEDVVNTVSRSAKRLRDALDAGPDRAALADVADEERKIFQTGYYQTLRLRPATGNDGAVAIRQVLGEACEAYDWASRMVGGSSAKNPAILDAARRLMDAGDDRLRLVARQLAAATAPAPGNTGP